ncbi:MAG: hypothetical protein J6Y96_00645 [Mycoplasma sp.]|nr:hypothetical protein [Mycoplasma sp.]
MNQYIYIYKLVKKLTKKLKRKPIIWLPFDTEQSEFAYFCRKHNFKYICSHKWDGKDFFKWEPKVWDIALSNPPFSRKLEVFKRLNSFNKPWAMIMNIMALNYQCIGSYFADNKCQLLIVDKRVSFNGRPSSFNSSFVCSDGFLPRDLIFVHIKHNNVRNNYISSRMCKDNRRKNISYVK